MTAYERDCCGACCRQLIVEADEVDLLPEPRLAGADPHYRGGSHPEVLAALQEQGRCLVIAAGRMHPCPFLAADSRCAIYPTRPTSCVAMAAGDEQCQASRQAAGLPPLVPTSPERVETVY